MPKSVKGRVTFKEEFASRPYSRKASATESVTTTATVLCQTVRY